MTIKVVISHGETGHPAPFFISKVNSDGVKLGAPITVKQGDTFDLYVHANQHLVISERPPGA